MSSDDEKKYLFAGKKVLDEASGRTELIFKDKDNPNDVRSFEVSAEGARNAIFQKKDLFSLNGLRILQRELESSADGM